jgi:CheY-like chemotaxis protein
VLLTPAAQVDLAERGRQLGVDRCLTKPVSASELREAVEALFGAEASEEPARGVTAEAVNCPPLRVLVADDSPVNREVAAGLLELYGHRVETVDNGREAVEAVQREDFDAVFMDVEMPEMDGLAATAAIRSMQAPTGRRIPIYAMTAHALAGFREQCLEAGMDGYISKPIRPEELAQALTAVYEKRLAACEAMLGEA